MARTGADLEELVRAYFARQGFFALRSVAYRFEDEDVTDIDAWLYGRPSASIRTRTIVDIKDKKSPKAFERILWARGMQLALGCDRAIVATTDGGSKIVAFAHQQKVSLLSKDFLARLQSKLDTSERMTLEQFMDNIRIYKDHKQDGDWIKRIADAKSALISLQGYPAFNKAIAAFSFFAERAQTRPHNKEQALRGAYLTAALACVALDSALERIVYEDHGARYRTIADGVTYGDAGDARVQNSINTVLEVIAKGVDNGRVVARQAREALSKMFENVRADIIAEHFVKEHNAGALVTVARELDDRAHAINPAKIQSLSLEAKSVLGVFADFVQAKRSVLLNGKLPEARNEVLKAASDVTAERKPASEMAAEQNPTSDTLMKQEPSSDTTTEQSPDRDQGKLL
ncbi:MAG: hypothetical protein WCE79_21910 [Xanthobacteraceae bacterium]